MASHRRIWPNWWVNCIKVSGPPSPMVMVIWQSMLDRSQLAGLAPDWTWVTALPTLRPDTTLGYQIQTALTTRKWFSLFKHRISSHQIFFLHSGISPNLLRLTTCTGIAEGGRAEWNFGYDRYNLSTLINEKNDLLRALTCSKDKEIINEYGKLCFYIQTKLLVFFNL